MKNGDRLPPFIDDTLRAELAAIDAEVRRRKLARVPMPFADWAREQRTEAIARQAARSESEAK